MSEHQQAIVGWALTSSGEQTVIGRQKNANQVQLLSLLAFLRSLLDHHQFVVDLDTDRLHY
jgi:hypothetical protein